MLPVTQYPTPQPSTATAQLHIAPDSPLNQAEFIFGVATASFQIEGAREQRLESIWDRFCDTEGKIADGSNGDHACAHIQRWAEDVALIEQLGVDAYRLSIAWGRVLDQQGQLIPQGVAFYQQLIAALKAKKIQVFVTLYHWDLPQYLEDQGGWLNRHTADAFAHYVEQISGALGDSVDAYSTLNEPFCSAYLGYELGIHAPGKTGQAFGRQAAHHLLLAHGLAMQVLQRTAPKARKGIVLNFSPCYPASESAADQQAAIWADQYHNAWYLMPLLQGRYPEVINQLPLANRPNIQAGDLAIIATPMDYLGINYYSHNVIAAPQPAHANSSTDNNNDNNNNNNDSDRELFVTVSTKLPKTAMGWDIVPEAFTDLLCQLHREYPLPPLYITENGAAFTDRLENGQVQDLQRLDYYQQHLLALAKAMAQGVDVRGYFAWSLLDNFEWAEGYQKRFGLVYVDYQSQQRTLKLSGQAWQHFLQQRKRQQQQ